MYDYNKLALKAVELQKKNKIKEAKLIYEDLLKVKVNPQILRLLGIIEYDEKNYNESLRLLNESLKIDPKNSECYSNRGIVNFALKNIKEAISDYEKAINLDQKNYNAFYNLGNLYKENDQLEKALENFNHAILINKNLYKAYHNRAVVKSILAEFKEAINDFDKAIEINPTYSNSFFFKSLVQLKTGDFENGWKNYEHRWNSTNFPTPKKKLQKPYWNGIDDLSNKTILIHGEQGLGDNIQFIRYFNIIKSKAKKALLQVDKRLVRLFQDSKISKDIFSNNDSLPKFDVHCPLLSLPFKLSTNIKNIPFNDKYLFPDIDRVKKWKKTFDKRYLNIGINWQASTNPDFDKGRSFQLNYFKNISLLKEIKLFSLQKINGLKQLDEKEESLKLNIINDFDNEAPFVDSAAIIENLDLVITCDTSIAHLSGALGKLTFLLLQKNSEWRWLQNINYSPWYESIKVFRQVKQDQWELVFKSIENDIINLNELKKKRTHN
jgi:Tfp pilus assembly protein PilF